MVDKLVKFIEQNNLNFDSIGSGLNSDCTIISGYGVYKGIKTPDKIIEAVKKHKEVTRLPQATTKEIRRVFQFAYTYNYGGFWKTERARREYTF